MKSIHHMIVVLSLGLTTAAFGQSDDDVNSKSKDLDPVPKAPSLTSGEPVGVKQQAGIGGNVAYSAAGVMEVGGFLNYSSANSYTEVGAAPMIGYFIADNTRISLLSSWSYSKIAQDEGDDLISNTGTLLFEPSLVIPLTNTNFVFGGFGFGALYERNKENGYAMAPRIGYKWLVGRSSMFTVAMQRMIGINEAEVQTQRGTVLTVRTANNVRLGFTVLL